MKNKIEPVQSLKIKVKKVNGDEEVKDEYSNNNESQRKVCSIFSR